MSVHKHIAKKMINEINGYGLFVVGGEIKKGDLLIIDEGKIIDSGQYFDLADKYKNLTYQIEDNKLLIPKNLDKVSDEWFVNHSCEPNTILKNGKWFAKHDLKIGDEITHDYVLLWANNIESFEIDPCLCKSKKCRGKFSGDDWKITELQIKYKGQFLPYMLKKIKLLSK